jgi:hypothetical protein
MSRTIYIVAALLLGGGVFCSSRGEANDRSLRALMIPASSCQVDQNRPFEENPFKRPDAIVRFTPGVYEILCPLPVNNIEMSGTGSDNDISRFRVTYRDTDGRGSGAEVLVMLNRTVLLSDGSGLRFVPVCRWSSNTDGPDNEGHTSDVVPCQHDVLSRNFYAFWVILDVTTADEVEFTGIDFP